MTGKKRTRTSDPPEAAPDKPLHSKQHKSQWVSSQHHYAAHHQPQQHQHHELRHHDQHESHHYQHQHSYEDAWAAYGYQSETTARSGASSHAQQWSERSAQWRDWEAAGHAGHSSAPLPPPGAAAAWTEHHPHMHRGSADSYTAASPRYGDAPPAPPPLPPLSPPLPPYGGDLTGPSDSHRSDPRSGARDWQPPPPLPPMAMGHGLMPRHRPGAPRSAPTASDVHHGGAPPLPPWEAPPPAEQRRGEWSGTGSRPHLLRSLLVVSAIFGCSVGCCR